MNTQINLSEPKIIDMQAKEEALKKLQEKAQKNNKSIKRDEVNSFIENFSVPMEEENALYNWFEGKGIIITEDIEEEIEDPNKLNIDDISSDIDYQNQEELDGEDENFNSDFLPNNEEKNEIDEDFDNPSDEDLRKIVEDGEDANEPLDPKADDFSEDSVRMYLHEIGKFKLLNMAEETNYSKQMEEGEIAQEAIDLIADSEKENKIDYEVLEENFHIKLNKLDEDKKSEKQKEKQQQVQEKINLLNRAYQRIISLKDENLYSDEEIKSTLKSIVKKGNAAKENLCNANLRLVVSIAKRHTGKGLLFLDLIQEGNLGLIKAVEKFDYTKGYKFSTYATWWIRQAITRAIADQGRTIRIPVHMVETINKYNRIHRQLLQEYGKEPTPERIAEELDMEVSKVIEISRIAQEPLSLEQPVGEEEDSHMGDFIPDRSISSPEVVAEKAQLREQLQLLLEDLLPRERNVIIYRYGLGGEKEKTLEEVGKIFGVTRERIRQIEAKALRKLRYPARSNKIKDYLE